MAAAEQFIVMVAVEALHLFGSEEGVVAALAEAAEAEEGAETVGVFLAVAVIVEAVERAGDGSSRIMKTQHFLSAVQNEKIVAAIGAAEARTSGEIRVLISRQSPEDALPLANQWFKKLKMDQTPDRNGVLILVAPRVHKFAVVGDAAIHAKCGETFWQQVVGEMATRLKNAEYTDALVEAVATLGDFLAKHFPASPGTKKNNLSDAVIES